MAKKIAVIDDEDKVLQFLQRLLSKNGYDVCTATNGTEGLEMIWKEKPDLVMTDILMPGKDGVAICEELRKSEQFKETPIILMTGVYRDFGRHVPERLVNAFVKKPFELKDVLDIIKRLIG